MSSFLRPYFTDAKNCVKNSTHMKKLCRVLKEPWRDWSRPKLVETGDMCRLAEIRQVEAVVEPPTQHDVQYDLRLRAPPAFDLSQLRSSLTAVG